MKRRYDPADGKLHYGTRYLPVVCGSCVHMVEQENRPYCWWLTLSVPVAEDSPCVAVTAKGNARFEEFRRTK